MKTSKLLAFISAILISVTFLSSCKISHNQDKDNVRPSESVPENTIKESTSIPESESIHTSMIENKFSAALSGDEIADALKAAESYYENTTQQVNKLSLAGEEMYRMFSIQEDAAGHVVIFEGEDLQSGVNRYIVLEYISEEWIVKTEGF